jgi:hypothetical protein
MRRLIIIVAAASLIIVSGYFIIEMTPYQGPPRQDAPWILGYMSAYTAWGSLGIMAGIYLIYYVIRGAH